MVSQKEMIVFLFVVVVLIFLGGVLLKILQQVPFIGGILSQIEGYIPQLTLPIEEEDESQSLTAAELLNIAPGDFGTTAGLVGCSIAKTIHDDFVLNGEQGKNRGENLGHYGSSSLNYLASAKFQIDFNQKTQKYFQDSDLTAEQKAKLKQAGCVDLEGAGYSPCPEKFDEACMNNHFGLMTFDAAKKNKFCTDGKKIITPSAGGEQISFGNKDCGKQTSGWAVSGCENCPSKNDDRIENLGVSGSEKKYDGAKYSSLGPATATDDFNFKKENFPPDCSDQKCSPTYRWSLFWDSKEKKYKFDVRKIPERADLGKSVGMDVMPDFLAYVFAGAGSSDERFQRQNPDRNSAAGTKWRDLRKKVDITFIADKDMNLGIFLDNFEKSGYRPKGADIKLRILKTPEVYYPFKVGEESWTTDVEEQSCSGEDCYNTKIEPVFEYSKLFYDKVTEGGEVDGLFSGISYYPIELGDVCIINQKNLFKIEIKNNLEGGTFVAGHKYNIVVNRFLLRQDGPKEGAKQESCGWLAWTAGECRLCWEPLQIGGFNAAFKDVKKLKEIMESNSCNNIATRSYVDCNMAYGIPINEVQKIKIWKDYSIIIVDLGEESPTTTTLRTTTSSTTSTQQPKAAVP